MSFRSQIKTAARLASHAAPSVMRDVVGLSGAGLLVYGAWLTYQPAGFITAGAFCLAVAWLSAARAG